MAKSSESLPGLYLCLCYDRSTYPGREGAQSGAYEGGAVMANQDPTTQTQWSQVSEEETDEIKFSFDVLGDQFIGTFLGQRTASNDNGTYVQYRFQGEDGNVYFINGNFNLQNGMKPVRVNSLVRITWTGEKDTGQASPMRLFRVEVGRRAPKPATK